MNYKYIYAPMALIEYKDAVAWYDMQSNRAAENFVIAVTEKIKNIRKNPSRYRNSYKFYRETSLKNIPTVLYILLTKVKKQLS